MSIIAAAKKTAEEWNKLTTDLERLQFLKDNNKAVKVVLDNDVSMFAFILPENIEPEEEDILDTLESEAKTFDNYHGWTDSIIELFKFAGITAESC